MRAIVKESAGPGLVMQEVPVPEPGSDDVLIRVLKSSICGTDVHIDTWDAWARATIQPPLVIGHEFVGEVVEVNHPYTADAKAVGNWGHLRTPPLRMIHPHFPLPQQLDQQHPPH